MQHLTITVFITLWCLLTTAPLFSEENRDEILLIERINFQKKISVKNLKDSVNGKLKNYRTFSFYVSDQLIFCHLSKDGSEPRVICH